MDGSRDRGARPPATLTGRDVKSDGDEAAPAKAGDITRQIRELDPAAVEASSRKTRQGRAAPPRRLSGTPAEFDQTLKAVPDDIATYWSELRNGRRYPSYGDLDLTTVAINWPNCLLLRNTGGAFQPDATFLQRMRAQHPSRYGIEVEPIEFSSMVVEWIVAAGLKAARSGGIQRMSEVFPVQRKSVTYRVVALPLSEDQRVINHVLCHVSLG